MIGNTRIAIRDSTDSFNIGFFDNEAGIKYHVSDLNRFLAGSASILTLRYYSKDIDTIRTGCKLSFSYKGKDYWLNILDIKKTGFNVELTAFSTNLEANSEMVGKYAAQTGESIESYFRRFDPERAFSIGINEVSEKLLKLEWTGTDTLLARLFSVANSFDAELEFVTKLNDDYSLKSQTVNIRKKGNIGQVIPSPVRVGRELKVINYEENIKELRTAAIATGKDGLTISGLDKKVYDDNKKLLFFTDGAYLRAPQAKDRFPSVGKTSADNYILLDLGSTEYETKEALYGYMLAELKKACQPEITFSTEGGLVGSVGDTMTLIDDIHYEPELYVQARIIETVESIITGQTTKTVLSNFERKYSQLSDTLLERVEELAKEAMPYTLELATNNGTVFKNGAGNSQITPNLKRGSETISGASFVWTINGTSTTASTYTVTADAVSGTAVVKVEAVLAGKAVASTEITFTNVEDGRDGRDGVAGRDGVGLRATSVTYGQSSTETIQPTSWTASVPTLVKGQYLWTKTVWTYTDNTNETGYTKTYIAKDGNNGTDGIAGKDGVGIRTTTITYGQSSSGTTQPTTWTTQVPSVPDGQYLWTKTVWTYTDNSTETGYSVAKMGEAGPKGERGLQGPKGDPGIPVVNLLKNSNFFKYNSHVMTSQTTEALTGRGTYYIGFAVDLKPNTMYTLSADSATKAETGNFNNFIVKLYDSAISVKKGNDIPFSGESTFTTPKNVIPGDKLLIYPTNGIAVSYDIRKLQLNEGNTKTPWSVSPDDMIAMIDSKATKQEVIMKTDVSVTDEGIIHSASKTVNGQTIASMIAQRAEWVEIIAKLVKVTGDMIVDGAITADKLNVAKLSSIISNLGEITGGSLTLSNHYPEKTFTQVVESHPPTYIQVKIPEHDTIMEIKEQYIRFKGTPSYMPIDATTYSVPNTVINQRGVFWTSSDYQSGLPEGSSSIEYMPVDGRGKTGIKVSSSKNIVLSSLNADIVLKASNYTDWSVSTVNRNVRWRVQGNLVIVDYDVTFPTYGTSHIVTVSTKYVPKALMLNVSAWYGNNTKDTKAQLNADGGLHIIGAEANQRYCGQIVWAY